MSQVTNDWPSLFAGRNGVRTLALAGGVALHAINVYVATTILPSVVSDIGGLEYYAWNTTLFVVASIVSSVLSTALLRRVGPRLAYVLAALVFATGTFVCAASPNMQSMLVGRALQGFGGGFLFALSYAMIRIVFDDVLWPRAMALVSGMWGVATLVGPAIGGAFSEWNAWRAAFWAMIPVALLFAAIAYMTLPARARLVPTHERLPFAQLIVLAAAILVVSVGSVSGEIAANVGGIAVAMALLGLLLRYERTTPKRILPKGAPSLRSSLGLLYVTLSLLAVAVTSSEIFAPLFLQRLHAQSPLMAGYLSAAMAAGWTLGSILSSGAEGPNVGRMIMAAPAHQLAGMVALAVLLPQPSEGQGTVVGLLALAMVLVGFGVGLGWPHLLTGVLKVAPDDEKDLATSSITTIQLCATAIGASIAGLVVNVAGLNDPGGLEGTATAAFALFAFFAAAPLIALITAARFVRRKDGHRC